MKRGLGFSALLGLCAVLTGCPFVVGDGLGVVEGRITDEQGGAHRGCFVELLRPGNAEATYHSDLFGRTLDLQKFRVDFVMAPGNRPYIARVGCATSEAVFVSPVLMLGGDPFKPVDLGVIVLPKMPIVAQ